MNCSAILTAIPSQPDSLVRLWMQVVCGLYPTMARLHRILPNKFRSANCSWCGANVPETLCHFVSVCPRFHDARTAAHNRTWQVIIADLKRIMLPGWRLFVETSIGDTGLLRNMLIQGASPSGRRPAQSFEHYCKLRPDAVAVNLQLKKIAIMDLTRPFDGCDRIDGQASVVVHPGAEASNGEGAALPHMTAGIDGELGEQTGEGHNALANADGRSRITAAAQRKMVAYSDLAKAIQQFQGESEWRVEVLPWVAGSKGVVDASGIN